MNKKRFFRERLITKQKTQIEPEDFRPKHSITKRRYFTFKRTVYNWRYLSDLCILLFIQNISPLLIG